MPTTGTATLCKAERQHRRGVIGQLFEGGGSKSISVFPLRVVYMPVGRDEVEAPVSILVSVPKRHFKRAVKRNRVKRQLREAYRLHKHILLDTMANGEKALVLAFIWLDKELHTTEELMDKMKKILSRIAEKMQQQQQQS